MVRGRLLIGVAACLVAGAAVAAPGLAGPGKGHGGFKDTPLGRLITGNVGRMMVLRSELDLTREQKAKIREILVQHKPEIVQKAKAVWEKRNALRDEVLSGETDEATLRKRSAELGDAIGDAAVLASKLRFEIAPVLTEEQRGKIKQCLADCDQAVEEFFDRVSKAAQ